MKRNFVQGHGVDRRAFMALLCAALLAATGSAAAQTYPARPIRVVVPFPAGGTVDSAIRAVSQRLSETMGQAIVVDNKPGANGSIGADAVAKAAPDGYTLLAVPSSHVINPATVASLPYHPVKDFSPIAILGTLPLVFAAGPRQPYKDLAEMIAHAKTKPGQLSFGYTDASTQLFGEMLKSAAGVDIRPVAYKGGAPMMLDIIGGHVEMGATGAGSAYPHYKAGKIRVLAVSEARRSPAMPDVPTVAESGVPGFDVQVWIAVAAPAGTPPAIVNRLNAEINKVIAEPAVATRLAELGTIVKGSTPAEATATMTADMQMWLAAARTAGLKPQ